MQSGEDEGGWLSAAGTVGGMCWQKWDSDDTGGWTFEGLTGEPGPRGPRKGKCRYTFELVSDVAPEP